MTYENRCLIDAFNCEDDCSKCSHYDKDSSVEIRLFDWAGDKVGYKRLTERELKVILDTIWIEMV